jgi:acyl-coenzyme A thioesterase PaaI-like protein
MDRTPPDNQLLAQWGRWAKWPWGRWLFSKSLAWVVPHAASIDARVEALSEGQARLRLRDRRQVRNHLKSIHAAALTHLAEMTANLALTTRQPKGARWIVLGMETRFLKKARGPIHADITLPIIDWQQPQELTGSVTLRDASADVVMVATQRWMIGNAGPQPNARTSVNTQPDMVES